MKKTFFISFLLLNITSLINENAFAQIDDFTIEPSGHLGGNVTCASVQDDFAFLGQGRYLTVLDITSDPPKHVASLNMNEHMYDLTVKDHICYIYRMNEAGMAIVDISDPHNPVLLDSLLFPQNRNRGSLFVSDSRLYAGTAGGLYVMDITTPTAPVILGSTTDVISDVSVINNIAYCLAGSLFKIYDVSGTQPVEMTSTAVSGARAITANSTHAFVAAGFLNDKTYIFDITNPQTLQQVGVFETQISGHETSPTSIRVEDNTAYIGCTDGLIIADITDPGNPSELSQMETDGWVVGIKKSNNQLHLFQQSSSSPYQEVNITQKSNPVTTRTYASPWNVKSILSESDRLYIASESSLWIYDITIQDQPTLIRSYPQWADFKRLTEQRDTLYALSETDLKVFDVMDASAANEISSFSSSSGIHRELAVKDNLVYLLVQDSPSRLEIVDMTMPSTPIITAQFNFNGKPKDLYIHENIACIVYNDGDSDRGVRFIDITNNNNPSDLAAIQTTGEPTCIWTTGNMAFVGSNRADTFHIQAIDITNPVNPSFLDEITGLGIIRDMEIRGDVIFAGVENGSIHTIVWEKNGFKLLKICPSPSTIDITVTEPRADVTGSTGTAYSSEGDTYDDESSGSEGIVFQKYILIRSGQGGLVTSVAPTAEAGTASPPTATGMIGSKIQVQAKESVGWTFTHWVNASPPENRKATAVLAAPPTEAVAHFAPILTLTPGALNPGYTMACPAEDEQDSTQTPVIQIQLKASPADDWELSSIGFQVQGNLQQKHVRRVNLHMGSELGPLLASTEYGTHFKFSVPSPYNSLSSGSGVTFMITMDFEDKDALGQGDPIQFTVHTNRTFIGATASKYPPGVILPMVPPIPTVLGGPIALGCVHNMTAQQAASTLQRAIDAETTLDGHVLVVCPGKYSENVEMNKSLILRSMEGADATELKADKKDKPVVTIKKPNVTLDDFTVTEAGYSDLIIN